MSGLNYAAAASSATSNPMTSASNSNSSSAGAGAPTDVSSLVQGTSSKAASPQSGQEHSMPTDVLSNLPAPSQKTFFIMRGAPGSGKSYLAKQILAKRTQQAAEDPSLQGLSQVEGTILSTDDYFLHPQTGEYIFDRTLLGQAHEWNQNRCETACQMGLGTVIVDNTNTCKWEAKPYVEIAQKYGYQVVVAEPTTPWWIARSVPDLLSRNTHGVPEEGIIAMLNRWEYGPWDAESILASQRPAPPPRQSYNPNQRFNRQS